MPAIDLPARSAALRRAFAECGILLEGLEFREIGGCVYQRADPPGRKDELAAPAGSAERRHSEARDAAGRAREGLPLVATKL